MEMYGIDLVNSKDLSKKIFYALRQLTNRYDRKILIGININGLSEYESETLKSDILNFSGFKVFLCYSFPLCVFSYVAKYKMCDLSVSLDFDKNICHIVLFSGGGYPANSYYKKSFLRFIGDYNQNEERERKGEIYNLKLENSLQQYIKFVFGDKSKYVKYIKNTYNTYYFKVKDTYYMLDDNFSSILNKSKEFILDKMSKFFDGKYDFFINDEEFDVYKYMLSRKITCIYTQDGSIIFSSSYYKDYLKVIYYMEFLC